MFTRANRLFTIRTTLTKMLSRRGYIVPSHVANETREQFDAMYTRKKVDEEFICESVTTEHAASHPADSSWSVQTAATSFRSEVFMGTDANASLQSSTIDALPTAFDETPVKRDSTTLTMLDFTVQHARNTTQTLMVFFPGDTDKNNIGIAPIRNYLAVMETHNCKHAILVVYESLTSPAVLMLKDLESKDIFVSFFAEGELMYDIYEHVRVPRHILLTPVQKQALLTRFKATECSLPKMQRHDPMARYLGLHVGDVVKIQRYSMTVAHDVYYRVVVDSEDFC